MSSTPSCWSDLACSIHGCREHGCAVMRNLPKTTVPEALRSEIIEECALAVEGRKVNFCLSALTYAALQNAADAIRSMKTAPSPLGTK